MEDKQILDAAAEEIQSIITEGVFNSRWDLIAAYHEVGRVMNETVEKEKIETKALIQDLGQKLHKNRSTFYYCLQFYKKYPDLSKLEGGKNNSWNKIILGLPGGGEEKKTPPTLEEKILALAVEEVQSDPSIPYRSAYPLSVIIEKMKAHTPKEGSGLMKVKGTPNEDVNEVIRYFKEVMKLPAVDGTVKETRQYAWLLLKNRGGLEQVKNLIQIASMDKFWNSKLASLKMLYYKSMAILKSKRDTPKGGIRL